MTVQGCSGTPVARADLKPGDLVFWYSPVGHVSMHIGNGQMVHARGTAYEVVQQSLDEDAKNAYFAGARRFVGPSPIRSEIPTLKSPPPHLPT